ncbi:MAG: response regulator transcription factor [Bacteroidaceae bacterium]|nr:response regulator transcription factor [Bacteroidaceae bacterium]
MKQPKILIVDDEPDLRDILCFNLMAAGYEANTAQSAEEALQSDIATYDLLLLDVMMPGLSGFEMAERLKAQPRTAHLPIIFLTARDSEADLLTGFDLGADDYIAKPFSIKEVQARVKAVLSRSATTAEPLAYQGLAMNQTNKTVSMDGEPVTLTKTEFELLSLFLAHRGRVFSRQEVMSRVWPSDVIVTDRTVDVNITRLRKKLGTYAAHIVTRPGYGYLFEE